jgi:hypothetical protein
VALNCITGVLTQPGSTGNQTISLTTSFDPKAIIMWTTGLPAPAGVGSNGVIGWGIGTYRGAVVQQGFQCHYNTDAAATMNVNGETGSDALIVLRPDGAATARDLEIDLVSMSSTSVVINWVNLHTTASIQVNYLILGGGDITDAMVWQFSYGATLVAVDTTIAVGFGKPDVVCLFHHGDAVGLVQLYKPHLGWGKSDTEERYFSANQIEGDTNAVVKMSQGDQMLEPNQTADTTTPAGLLQLADRASWPTDGIEVTKGGVNNAFADDVFGLALRGSFTCTVGSASSPTITGTQDLSVASGVPKAIFMWGGNLPTGSGFILSHADLVAWGIGASDMTTGVYAGVSDDDGLGTSDTNRSWTDQVVWQARGAANALLQECTASVIGQVVRLNWTTVDGTAREFNYIIFGEIPAVPVFEDPNLCAWGPPVPKISPLAT